MKMIRQLFPLAIGGIALGSTEFMPMGLMRTMGESLALSDSQVGRFIAAYAIGVVVGAPTLVGLSTRFQPQRVLIALMLLFTLFNGLFAVMPSYSLLLGSRFFSGLPHGAFFGVGAIVAKQLAPKDKEAMAISVMFGGLTIANLLVIPLFTHLGTILGWRPVMGMIAALGLITASCIFLFLPKVDYDKDKTLWKELQHFFSVPSMLLLVITALGCGGLFSWLSYIEPLMLDHAGLPKSQMPTLMVVVGLGMVVGNFFGGWLTDKLHLVRASVIVFIAMISVLVIVFFFSHLLWLAWGLTFVCAVVAMSVGAPLNMMMFRVSPQAQMMGAAFMQAAFNLANTLGAYLGGKPLDHGYTANYPSLVGAGMASAGFLCAIFLYTKYGKLFRNDQ